MSETTLATEFSGKRSTLFWLALRTSLLTVLTVGLYRFWMKTRLRRWYWSAVRPGGHPLEYVGEPLEKLLGFLIAVVFLAFYLGLVNLGLMFASLSLFSQAGTGYSIWFLGLLPLLFFARYRARRYILARTRWRGLRFGLEPAAWAYSVCAIWHWALTILTLGLYWPVMAFKLEKFRTDRTWFGNARLNQGGTRGMLYPAAVHLMIGLVMSLATIGLAYSGEERMLFLLGLSIPWSLFGLIYWRVESLRLLTNAKTFGGNTVTLTPRITRIGRIYVLASIGLLIMFLIASVLIAAVAYGLYYFLIGVTGVPTADAVFASLPPVVAVVFGVGTYALLMLGWGVLTQVFITFPVLRHYVETLTLSPTHDINRITQREDDAVEGAEGFAEALDVGAAI